MCFCCTSVESAFAWTGAIVVNVAFLSLITWGATTYWLLGFGLCLVYTILLFGLALWLDQRSFYNDHDDGDGVSQDATVPSYTQIRSDSIRERTNQGNENEHAATMVQSETTRPILVSILYGLAVVSLGASGFFLPVNLLHCGDVNPPTRNDAHWVTNISALPKQVQAWAAKSNDNDSLDRGDGDSFVYLPYSGVTLFQGHQDGLQNKCTAAQRADGNRGTVVWASQPYSILHRVEEPPICFNISYPSEFKLVSDKEACFVAVPPSSPTPVRYVHCSDGKSIKQAKSANLLPDVDCPEMPHNLISSLDGVLWYKKGYDFDERGQPIFSLDFTSMQEIIHSTFQKQNSSSSSDNNGPIPKWSDEDCTSWIPRLAAIATVFASAVPMVLVSIALWCKRQVPSMSITTFLGLTVMAFSIFMAVVGITFDDAVSSVAFDNFTDWWCFSSALVGLIIMTDLFFSNQVDKKPLAWAINFLALVYVAGLAMITTREMDNEIWFWLALNIMAVIPLGILGIAVGQILLVAICAVGFLADAFRLASWLIDRFLSNNEALAMPIYFVVLAVTGLAIAAFGWILNKHQDQLHSALVDFMERYSISGMMLEEGFYFADAVDSIHSNMRPILNEQDEEQDITVPAQRHEDLT
jgi:hypothetical protein